MKLIDDVKCLLELVNDSFYNKAEYLLDRWEDEKKYENPYPYQYALANYFKEQGYPNLTVDWNNGNFLIKIPVNHYQTVVIQRITYMSKLTVKLLKPTIKKLKENFHDLTIHIIQSEIVIALGLSNEDVDVRVIDNGFLIKIYEEVGITMIAITEGTKEN